MVSRVATAFLALLALPAAWAGIDFTPIPHETSLDGTPLKETAIRDGSSLVIYVPPGDWDVQGAGSLLRMTPKTGSLADATIEARPLPGTTLDETVEKTKAELQKALPREAENVGWEEVEVNPVMLNQHPTRRLTVAYTAFAQRLKTTVVICDFAEEEIRFRLNAREVDFEKLYDLFRHSLYTWQGKK